VQDRGGGGGDTRARSAAPWRLARRRKAGLRGGLACWLMAADGVQDRGGCAGETRATATNKLVQRGGSGRGIRAGGQA
jgi:hypothetical protein